MLSNSSWTVLLCRSHCSCTCTASFPGHTRNGLATSVSSNCYRKLGVTIKFQHCNMTIAIAYLIDCSIMLVWTFCTVIFSINWLTSVATSAAGKVMTITSTNLIFTASRNGLANEWILLQYEVDICRHIVICNCMCSLNLRMLPE